MNRRFFIIGAQTDEHSVIMQARISRSVASASYKKMHIRILLIQYFFERNYPKPLLPLGLAHGPVGG
jgi:hypothetical protein